MKSRILVVDDDPQVYRMLSAVLAPHLYEMDSVLDGYQAWELLQKDRPDLIILDIMMPEMSGIDLCKKIKNDPLLKDSLVLMLSAKDTQADRLEGLHYGADDYVTKPFHVSTLVHKIEHMLKKKS